MKTLELNQMENLNGGTEEYCTKSATKMLITLGATCVAAATGNIFMTVWGVYSMIDMVDDCESW